MKTNLELENILIAKFHEYYPKDKIPAWLNDYLNFRFYMNKEKNRLEFKVYLEECIALEKGEYWEDVFGVPTIVSIDPETQEKNIAISYEHKIRIVFKAFLPQSFIPEIEESADIDHLRKEDFIPRRG